MSDHDDREQDQQGDQDEQRPTVGETPSEEEIKQIEEERERRLDPENRPENAEVDNTQRTFEDGEFKD